MFEKPMNQNLGTTEYGNRVHTTNREPLNPPRFTASTYTNPRNDLVKSMEGMGKDSDRTTRRIYQGE